ncbi:hypothetical protein B7494_g892 [Chlorociboria aeruginascens]|nr:hypothetical protein B7494_g892 [Chlorociboria aeruginascens]
MTRFIGTSSDNRLRRSIRPFGTSALLTPACQTAAAPRIVYVSAGPRALATDSLVGVPIGTGAIQATLSSDDNYLIVEYRSNNWIRVEHIFNSLVANVQVGTSPVGLTLIQNDRHIITADSNLVDTEAALKGKQRFPKYPLVCFHVATPAIE